MKFDKKKILKSNRFKKLKGSKYIYIVRKHINEFVLNICKCSNKMYSNLQTQVCIYLTGGRKIKLLGRNVHHNETMCRAQI
jgi:hypothetical protein